MSLDHPSAADVAACADCGTEFPRSLLACPNCHRLLHADALTRLADTAAAATAQGDLTAALVAWRSALELLPANSRQHEAIQKRIAALGRQIDAQDGTPPQARPVDEPTAAGPRWNPGAGAAGMGGLALALWKFKFLVLLVLSKGKLLLLGLTKLSTFTSMLVAMGAYATIWGWKFAVGLILSIYIHEMGHVSALLRYGIKASAPMFVPGLGAMVRLNQPIHDVRQEARVALAGPLWGMGAALGCFAVFLATGLPFWGAMARTGALINLFNLLPIWQLDGGRAFHSLTRPQRWLAAAAVATMWSITSEGFTFLIMLVAASQAAFGKPAREPDRFATFLYIALIVALSAMTMIPVVLPG